MVQSVVMAYTVSQKSRTGLRFALTEVSRAGTVAVSRSAACTPPVTAASVRWIAHRWPAIRIRPTAVNTMIRPATAIVIQAAAGMVASPSLAEQFRDGARIPDRADLDFLDALVGDGQAVRDALEFADQGGPAGQDGVARRPDPFQRAEHPAEQGDHDREYHHEQNRVADPPQDHGWASFRFGGAVSSPRAGRAGKTAGRPG